MPIPASRDSITASLRYALHCGPRRKWSARSDGLQRFFSTFPGSGPGIGLLVLRVVVGAAAIVQGGQYIASADRTAGIWIIGLMSIASGTSLVAGILTPGAGAVAASATMAIALNASPSAASRVLIDSAAALIVTVNAVALVLLGPGAYSIDAYLFGRREIVIPRDTGSR